jgi:hypothetical protein
LETALEGAITIPKEEERKEVACFPRKKSVTAFLTISALEVEVGFIGPIMAIIFHQFDS